jgi:Tol biopolymer transport system component
VAQPRFQDALWPAWSPDGTILAYTDARSMTLCLFRDGTSTPIVDGIEGVHGEIERIQWSPDGTKLAFGLAETTRADTPTGTVFLYTINADGTGLTQVVNDIRRPELDLFTSFYFGWRPFDWSPDSTTLVYSSGFETAGLYTVKVDGTDRQTLIRGEVQHNGQAVSGQFFEFQSVDWSPDGTLIAFSARKYPSFDIYTIRPDGTDLRPLIASPQHELAAVWQPVTP